MVDTASTDVLMYVISKGTDPIPAECSSLLDDSDTLTTDFKTGKFFEAENFTFSIKLKDDEGTPQKQAAPVKGKEHEKAAEAKPDTPSYSRWRAIKQDGVKPSPPFRAEPDDFSLTRRIDAASPILLQHCLDIQRFDKVVVVKRVRAPSDELLTGFLRLEFAKVYLKSVEWTDGDAVREACKFKYASVNVTYLKRTVAGATDSSWSCKWESPVNA